MIPILGAAIPPLNSLNLPSASLVRDWFKPSYSEMNGIIGMTELALDTKLTTERCDYHGMVKRSAASLLTLINDIPDFSKIEGRKT